MTGVDSDVLVVLDGVGKRWDESSGLRPVTMEVRTHELVAVRGRSGSGKSTLLAILAGWCAPDHGEVRWGPPLSAGDPRAWDHVAVVPQVLALMGELSARENVEIALRGCGVDRTVASTRAGDVLASLSLSDLANRLPAETSVGQRQRTALARALVVEPKLLLADEPTSHQDAASARQVVDALRQRAELGGGVLVATHDEMVVAAADRVVTLDD
ncbi:MAG TPA: ATP-binding cassette domain-containing protein [Acidimicrobiales bacterium]|nr:ATP-binding cassette domain-containing protein [Acidimicrobiales bacterium]